MSPKIRSWTPFLSPNGTKTVTFQSPLERFIMSMANIATMTLSSLNFIWARNFYYRSIMIFIKFKNWIDDKVDSSLFYLSLSTDYEWFSSFFRINCFTKRSANCKLQTFQKHPSEHSCIDTRHFWNWLLIKVRKWCIEKYWRRQTFNLVSEFIAWKIVNSTFSVFESVSRAKPSLDQIKMDY